MSDIESFWQTRDGARASVSLNRSRIESVYERLDKPALCVRMFSGERFFLVEAQRASFFDWLNRKDEK